MKEIKGNMFKLLTEYDAICITTNGTVKKDGCAVMGRGCALEAKRLWWRIDKRLGGLIELNGNITQILGTVGNCKIIAFPVKHHWSQEADLELIEKSARKLVEITGENEKVLIPRPGCGNGKLDWKDVRPVLEEILDDRFYIIDFE